MNKRAFLKLSSATIASSAISPLSAWAAPDKLTNWAGNLEYSTELSTPPNERPLTSSRAATE
jgi:xylitol oxidase